MDPERRVCAHLASAGLTRLAIAPDDVLDWADGATVAVVRCPDCDGCALLELLDWSADRRVRVFALSAIGGDEVALFLRDVQRGSCDPARLRLEQEALLATAGAAERMVALEAHGDAVLGAAVWPAGLPRPGGSWRDRLPPATDDSWFRHVGLDKASPTRSRG